MVTRASEQPPAIATYGAHLYTRWPPAYNMETIYTARNTVPTVVMTTAQ